VWQAIQIMGKEHSIFLKRLGTWHLVCDGLFLSQIHPALPAPASLITTHDVQLCHVYEFAESEDLKHSHQAVH